MKKLLALLLSVLLLCATVPLSVFAADGDETIIVTANTGVLDGTTSISWDGTSYRVINYKGNSSTALRTADADHFRVYVGNEFYVQGKDGALMSQVVIECVSSYLINNASNTVNDGWTVAANGTTITYTATSGAAEELHISIGKQSRVKSVVITPAVAGGANCDHASLECGTTCPECGEYTKEHVFANNCAATCSNCDAANPNYAGHVYDGAYDAFCNVCNAEREVNFPEFDTELTILEADAIGLAMSHNTTTPGKYYVTGVVESIVNTTYGNLYIQDEVGNKLYIYGSYSADGSVRFDAMAEKPEVGMTITVYGVIGTYSNASQMKNVWVTSMEGGCQHKYTHECSKSCSLCGLELRPEAECVNGSFACQDGLCIYCGGDVDALEHAFDDQWDPDCNYGCGYTREVEERPELTEATVTFDADRTQRTEYSTSAQKWENGGLVVLNEKAASTSNVGDYSNPGRFYKLTTVTIFFHGMTILVIDATSVPVNYLWDATLDTAGLTYTVEEKVYTITFAEPVDSLTLSMVNQCRVNAITAIAVNDDGHVYDNVCDVDCNVCGAIRQVPDHVFADVCDRDCDVCGFVRQAPHIYDNACDDTCNICGMRRKPASHVYVATVTKQATCLVDGVLTHTCTACGDTYTESIPAVGYHVYSDACDADCNACGVKREPPHNYSSKFDEECDTCGAWREVPPRVIGDLNMDDSVNNLDMALLQRHLTSWVVEIDEIAADVEPDGYINNLDLAILQRFVNGWDVTLG